MIRILYVDHNDVERDFIRKSLLRIADDIEIHEAKTAKQTFEALEKHDYDCIMAEINTPDLSGFSFLQAIRSKDANIPFVFVSSQGGEKQVLEALRAGASDYFTKGGGFVHYERVITRIKELVAQKILLESRQENAAALKTNEKKYRKIIDSSIDLIIHLNEEGKFTFVSRACEPLLGYKAREMKNKSFFDFVGPEEQNRVRKELFAKQGELELCQITSQFRCKSGDYVILETNFNVIKDSRGKKVKEIIGVSRDVTEKDIKEVSEEDPFLEDKLHLIDRFEFPVLIVQPGIGRVLKYNPMGAELFNFKDSDKKPVLPTKFFKSPDDRKFIFNHLRKHGVLQAYDIMLSSKKDGEIWYSIYGSSIEYEGESAFLLVFLNINKRKVAERKMEDRNETLEETQKRLAEELKKTKKDLKIKNDELESTERDLKALLATLAVDRETSPL